MTKQADHRSSRSKPTKGPAESQHSHFEYGSTQGRWDQEDGSDFAITSVNVPDRLDTQEVRNRAADDRQSSVSRFHRDDVGRFIRWSVILLGLVAVAVWAGRWVSPIRAAISPAGVEAQVSKALGVPVSVAATELKLLPTPRLSINGMVAQSGWRLPEIALNFNWRDVLHGLQTSAWAVGEARVAAVELSGHDALALLQSVRAASQLPIAVSTIRFESVSFPDFVALPGRYEAVARRDGKKNFGDVTLRRLDGGGQVDIEISPPAGPGTDAQFAFFATEWLAAIGPSMTWREATAQGEFRADRIKIDSYSLGAQFGNLNGAAILARDPQGWRLTGHVRSPDVSLEELTRRAAGLGGSEAELAKLPLRGTAKVNLELVGAGATLAQALAGAKASGPVSVSGATLNGLNLGLVATQGGIVGAGGNTRFNSLDFDLTASREGLAVRNVSGRAGGLRVFGGFSVDRKLQLDGSLRSEVASPRGVTATSIRIGGTATAPTYR